ncbi:ERAP1-like C-terminal domain-containing protein [Tunturiibacter gelidiferens]|uniref:ERAP1-like C-terminal domain-containing protein n=1 Tax=Tunturiibacter gelidiferens TaxID=3069689 RepID=UPI003D9BACD9
MRNVFDRSLLWGSLWASVRLAKLPPIDYLQLALQSLPTEHDEALATSILQHVTVALHRYVSPSVQAELTDSFAKLAADRMVHDEKQDMRIVWFRQVATFAQDQSGRVNVKALLRGQLTVPGVQLRQQDRWRLVTALIAYGDPEANIYLAEEERRDPSGDGKSLLTSRRPLVLTLPPRSCTSTTTCTTLNVRRIGLKAASETSITGTRRR